MEKKHIITIAGKLGSGKSSTAKRLAEILGYKHYSAGDFMRSMANEKGISLAELCEIAETNDSVDQDIDKKNLEVGETKDSVIDSRLGFHFIPQSFKVFLELDPSVASERILKDKETNPNRLNESSENFNTQEDIMKSINDRLQNERNRYKKIYGIEDLTDHDHFDLVIDTAQISLEEVSQKIIEEYNKWLEK